MERRMVACAVSGHYIPCFNQSSSDVICFIWKNNSHGSLKDTSLLSTMVDLNLSGLFFLSTKGV